VGGVCSGRSIIVGADGRAEIGIAGQDDELVFATTINVSLIWNFNQLFMKSNNIICFV
jgi:hypothetical protein